MRGELNSMDSWKFVSRFCFLQCSSYDASTGACDDEVSQIKYELTLPSHSAVDILVYTSSYQNWTEVYTKVLTNELGFKQEKSTPCAFFNHELQVRVVVHGDDFVSEGPM